MKKILIIVLSIFLIYTPKLNASDNVQTLDIYVSNIDGEYYLDILFLSSNKNYYNNIDDLNNDLVNKLSEYEGKFNSSYALGSYCKLTREELEKNHFKFNYYFYSGDYKNDINNRIDEIAIIVSTDDGIKVSEIVKISLLNSKISYNYNDNKYYVSQEKMNIFSYIFFVSVLFFICSIVINLLLNIKIVSNLKKNIIVNFLVPLLLISLIGFSKYYDIKDFVIKNIIIESAIYLIISIGLNVFLYKEKKVLIRMLFSLTNAFIFFLINMLAILL